MKYLMLAPLLLLAAIGALMAAGLVPPNGYVGYRSGRSLSDPALWYAINARAGFALGLASLLAAAGVWAIYRRALDPSVQALLSVAALITVAIVTVIAGRTG